MHEKENLDYVSLLKYKNERVLFHTHLYAILRQGNVCRLYTYMSQKKVSSSLW